jgi:hypothetical protein
MSIGGTKKVKIFLTGKFMVNMTAVISPRQDIF